jgi:hypothetical protein
MGIAIKGPAQHNPFTALALAGHFVLFFILLRIKEIDFRNLPKIMPKAKAKLVIQITG